MGSWTHGAPNSPAKLAPAALPKAAFAPEAALHPDPRSWLQESLSGPRVLLLCFFVCVCVCVTCDVFHVLFGADEPEIAFAQTNA